jgi:Uma2 family endonuclease
MALADPAVHRFTSAEYDALVASGALAEAKVELVDGLVLEVSPQSDEHAVVVRVLTRLLAHPEPLLAVQCPLKLMEGWRPEPDLALAELPRRGRDTRAWLVVEVCVSAHREARAKLPGYRAAGVEQVWLVDVPARAVEVHRPDGSVRIARGDDVLDPEVEGVAPFRVAEVFARLEG